MIDMHGTDDPHSYSDRGMAGENEIITEDIDRLKQNWLNDPCWDIEFTEGFEAFHDELLEYRQGEEEKWTAIRDGEIQDRAKDLGVSVETVLQIEKLEATVNASTKTAAKVFFHALNIEIEEAENLVGDLVTVAIASIRLDSLKTTIIPPTSAEQIEILLNAIRINASYRSRFSPRVYEDLKLEVDDKHLWMSTLSTLARKGVLIENFEVVDPVSGATLAIYHKAQDIPIRMFSVADPSVEMTQKHIFLTYSFVGGGENVSQK